MPVRVYSAVPWGVEGALVRVEVGCLPSQPKILMTGLPSEVMKESRDRIRACLASHGFDVPQNRLIVHLAPADRPKQGSQCDLAIALGILAAEGRLNGADLSSWAFLGELGMDGRLKQVAGAAGLLQAILAKHPALRCVVPSDNALEASLFPRERVKLASSLRAVLRFLGKEGPLESPPDFSPPPVSRVGRPGLDSVKGQAAAKRALTIALAGGHHLLLVGSPGTGKSLLAQCAEALLPPLSAEERIESFKTGGDGRSRPFRSPHHTISAAGLLGGGSGSVSIGEVTRAHRGVLFLDEIPEFRRDALEGLREPLEAGHLHVHRVGHSLRLPAEFLLLAAMNPCPCGYALSEKRRCRCRADKADAYRKRLSGPLLDRIDLCVVMREPTLDDPTGPSEKEALDLMARVRARRGGALWVIRSGEPPDPTAPGRHALSGEDWAWLGALASTEGMSLRGLHKIVRVARTIADIEDCDAIARHHLAEAWLYRCPGSFWSGVSA